MIRDLYVNKNLLYSTKLEYELEIKFQNSEIYVKTKKNNTDKDLLLSISGLTQELNKENGYSIGNISIVLKNKDNYFSKKLDIEALEGKVIIIYYVLGSIRGEYFKGTVPLDKGWNLLANELKINLTI